MERYQNKRQIYRSCGKFAKAPSLGQIRGDINETERRCLACGEVWFPILVNGICPECGAQNSEPILKGEVSHDHL